MKITKTIGKENFDKLYLGKQIPEQYSLNGKDINTRCWVDDCRFLFVKNDQDGLVYCYVQPDITKSAVLISKATEEKALNVFKGNQKFVASINMTNATTALKESLFEMQSQPDFMKMFASVAKTASAKSQAVVLNQTSNATSNTNNNTKAKREEDYMNMINEMIAEGIEMKDEIADLKKQNEEFNAEKGELVTKLGNLKTALEEEQDYVLLLNDEHNKEIEALLEEASSYIDKRNEYADQLAEAYKNYDALGEDYEALEKAKKDLENEYNSLGEDFKNLYKDFTRMKKSNARNSTSFRHALDEIKRLNDQIEMQIFAFNMIGGAQKEERDFAVHNLRAQNKATQNNAEKAAVEQKESYKQNLLKVLSDKKVSQTKLVKTLQAFEELSKQHQDLLDKYQNDYQQMLTLVDTVLELEEKNNTLSEENKMAKELIFKKAEEIVKDTNENKEKMYELTAKADQKNKEKRIYLAVGPHWEAAQRLEGKTGKDYNTLYVIEGGDPSGVQDKDGVVMKLEDILTDADLREIYNIRAVKRIRVDKDNNAKVEYYDTKTQLFTGKEVLKSNFVIEAKDVNADSLKTWVADNYDATANKVVTVAPTFKTTKVLKYASIFASAALVAGTLTFESVRAWGGPNEAEQAQNYGKSQIETFVENLNEAENGSLFQYAPAVDEFGNVLSYTKVVNGQGVAVEGNKVDAIGNANKVFYDKADNKVIINTYTQESFWGKLRNYKEDTLVGAAYQLGAEVVEELSENNVPVYTFEENSSVKKPLYVYLNFASENTDYSNRDAMLAYLKENGYSNKLAEKITAAYEEGFSSGLENGLSNKVNEIIGSTDVVTPELPPVSFTSQDTKNAIVDKVTETTLHGKQYTADELHVIYSDLDTDGEQVMFVAANKDGATGVNTNKYLYKIVLGDGSNEITSENLNETIANASEVTESVKLEFMFKDQAQFGNAVNRFYSKISAGSVAYVSDYALGQTENGYCIEPTLTIYNVETETIEEQNSKYVVSVDASKNSSITEMCALALLGDYGYYDKKGIYSIAPTTQSTAVKTYSDNDRELN